MLCGDLMTFRVDLGNPQDPVNEKSCLISINKKWQVISQHGSPIFSCLRRGPFLRWCLSVCWKKPCGQTLPAFSGAETLSSCPSCWIHSTLVDLTHILPSRGPSRTCSQAAHASRPVALHEHVRGLPRQQTSVFMHHSHSLTLDPCRLISERRQHTLFEC